MNFNLAKIVGAFLFALTSYQSVLAGANNFTAQSVRVGDNLLSILKRQGFTEQQREQVLASDKGLRNLFLTLDTKYLIQKSGSRIELRMYDSQTSAAFRITKDRNRITANEYTPRFKTTLLKVNGQVRSSLLGSVLAQIKSNWVATRFVDAYVFDLQEKQSLQGARFSLAVEKLYEHGQFIKYGEVLNTSLDLNGTTVYKKFIKSRYGGVFFNEQDLLENKPFFSPVHYIKVASGFKPNRLHPITGRLTPHLGIDFELPVGEPILAPKKGLVVRYGNNHAAGNYIVLLHSNGMESSYNHLHKIDRRIRVGLKVNAGEKIGEVGCTGYCTRAHLHFALKHKGRMVDPIKYMKSYPVQMERFLEERVARN